MNNITSFGGETKKCGECVNHEKGSLQKVVVNRANHRSIVLIYGAFISNSPLILQGNTNLKEVVDKVKRVLNYNPVKTPNELSPVNGKSEISESVTEAKKPEFNFDTVLQEIKYRIFECRYILLSGIDEKFHSRVSKKLIRLFNLAKTILSNRDSTITRMLELKSEGHFSKKCNLGLDFSVTKIGERIFVHIPKSILQTGTEKIIKLAIEIEKGDLVIYAKSGQRMHSNKNEMLVNSLCGGGRNFKEVYGFGEYLKSRNRTIFQTFMKIYSKGDAFNQCSAFKYNGKYSLNQMLEWGLSAANGINDLHEKKLTHNDVKLENFLLSDDKNKLILIDFGFVVDWRDLQEITSEPLKGTSSYLAPERIKEIVVTFEEHKMGDIYSLGVCFYILMIGTFVPWQNTLSEALKLKRMSQQDFNKLFPEPLNRRGYEHLCWRMLQYDFNLRPTIEEVVKTLENFKCLLDDDEKKFPLAETGISYCSSHFL